jgi:hypothetical protein
MGKITYKNFAVIFAVDDDCRNNRMVELQACDANAAKADVMEAYAGIEILVVIDRGPHS